MSEELEGTAFCPKCGFKLHLKKPHIMECLLCRKNIYGEYPRYRITHFQEQYGETPTNLGYICKNCAAKIGLSVHKENIKETKE